MNTNRVSVISLNPNIAAGLSYVAGWVIGLIIFLMEKRNRFVRFHAIQSMLFSVTHIAFLSLIGIVATSAFPSIHDILLLVGGLINLAVFVIWIILLVNAFQGKYFKLPVIGDYAERYANPAV